MLASTKKCSSQEPLPLKSKYRCSMLISVALESSFSLNVIPLLNLVRCYRMIPHEFFFLLDGLREDFPHHVCRGQQPHGVVQHWYALFNITFCDISRTWVGVQPGFEDQLVCLGVPFHAQEWGHEILMQDAIVLTEFTVHKTTNGVWIHPIPWCD